MGDVLGAPGSEPEALVLLASGLSRTVKFLLGLAAGVCPVGAVWALDSAAERARLPIDSYKLDAGFDSASCELFALPEDRGLRPLPLERRALAETRVMLADAAATLGGEAARLLAAAGAALTPDLAHRPHFVVLPSEAAAGAAGGGRSSSQHERNHGVGGCGGVEATGGIGIDRGEGRKWSAARWAGLARRAAQGGFPVVKEEWIVRSLWEQRPARPEPFAAADADPLAQFLRGGSAASSGMARVRLFASGGRLAVISDCPAATCGSSGSGGGGDGPTADLFSTSRSSFAAPAPALCAVPAESSEAVGEAAVLTLQQGGCRHFSIRTTSGRFVTVYPDGALRLQRTTSQLWEQFTIRFAGEHAAGAAAGEESSSAGRLQVSLLSCHGGYLSAPPHGGALSASAQGQPVVLELEEADDLH